MAPAMSLAKAAVPVGVRQLSHRQQARKVSGVRRPHRVVSPVIAAASRSSKGVNAVSGSVDIPALKGAFPNVIPERCTADETEWEQISEDLNSGRKPSLPCSCLTLGVPKESYPGEMRVAATPSNVTDYINRGFNVLVESGAGAKAGFSDEAYLAAGAAVVPTEEAFGADVVVKVRAPQEAAGKHEVDMMARGGFLISFIQPAQNSELVKRLEAKQMTVIAMDCIPRTISRAQAFDALSSMANIAGYRAVVEATHAFGRFLGGQMTAAGKVNPAKVLVIGGGVAGLAAIVQAKNLGAVVRCFDTRPEVKEQVESLGGEFIYPDMQEDGTGAGGYAKEMSKEFIDAEMRLFADQCKEIDIVITTALIPGRKAFHSQRQATMVLPSSTSARLAAYTAIAGAGAVAYMYATRSRSGAAVLSAARRYFPRPGRTVSIKMRAIPAGGAPQGKIKLSSSEYPPVRRDDSVVETLHGVEVADPYRWLEDPDAEETKQFVAAQNKVTDGVLAQCQNRAPFKKLLTRMMDYPKYGCPFKRGDRYYYFHNTGLQAQYVLYTQATLEGEARVLLDPNTLSTDGTVALGRQKFSDDGKLMAFELSTGGSDWKTVQVLRVEEDGSPTWLPDKLDHVKFSSLCFTMDGKGIFYNCYEPPSKDGVDLGTETDINLNQQLRYHQLGTPQEEDPVVYAIPEFPDNMIGAQTTDDGSYLLMTISSGCLPTNKLYYVDLRKLKRQEGTGVIDFAAYDFYKGAEKLPVVKLVDNFDASYDYVANDGAIFTFQTNLDAPRYRLVRTELSGESPASVAWEDLLAQHEQELLESAVPLAGELMVVEYLRDVRSVLQLRSLATAELVEELELPGLGAVQSFSGRRKDSEFFFSFTSLVEPGATYRVDVSSGRAETSLFRRVEIEGYSADDFVMEQLFVKSADGTSVPMFVAHRRGLPLDGSSPCHLYGYGGFNISLSPYFSCSRAAFMKGVDGVYCSANLRGGGEYGVSWRDAGSLGNKQKVFDDFQACAEHLIESGYTSSNKLFINGGSNGGLLVAACVNQRPDLYAAAVAQVGVMDMLRFHKFTIGHAWTKDFGDPDDPEQFKFLLPYSPLHNVALPTNGQYPAMMLTTGDHDDRVVPLHSHKLIATLQYAAAQRGDGEGQQLNPLITRIDVKSGHGAGKPTQKVIEEVSDMYGFVTGVMGVKWALQD